MKIAIPFNRRSKAHLVGLILLFIHLRAYSQSCNCPPIDDCGACQGGLVSLTLKYHGLLGLGANIVANDDGPGVLFNGFVADEGTFTFTGSNPDGTFDGGEVRLTGLLINVTINTSCGTPVNVGSDFGNFTVMAGESKDGGGICCAPVDMENIPPVISNCPPDISVALGATSCTTTVNWTVPTAVDNCGTVTLTGTHNSGDIFLLGTTPVTYTATDDYGNTSTCSFDVVVNDNTNPVIAGCPPNITVSADASCKAIVNWTAPTASDNCSISSFTSTHTSGFLFSLGTTPVTYTATDGSGRTSTCTFNVIVNDNTNPVITGCPTDIVVLANASCQAIANWTAPTASDNCLISSFTSTHTSGFLFSLGTTPVTYTATDGSGNISTCSFNVIVNDNTNPAITGCLSNISVSADASCQAIVNWTAPTASDNCSIASFTSTHISGALFSLGTTPVTYTATDGSGNISTCSFNVIVNDNTNPIITGCPSDITVPANASCQAIVNWTAPTATDNCSISSFTSTHTSGFLFPLGTTPVTYTATDGSGNVSTCSFNVIVNDDANPVIAGCPSDITVSANASCQAIVNWTAPTATDNCSISSFTSTHTSGFLFPLGTTPVTYTATDGSGNVSTCSFNVIVNDNTNPVITACPSNITISANASCQAIANWTAPTATDNCSISSFTSTHTSGSLFSLGTTPVTYTATDGSGRTSICTFNVTVNDNTNPVITGCPSNITISANASCQAIATWTAPTASDNCSISSFTSTHTSGSLFSLGTTPVTYTATDGSGRTSICTFNVIVNDNTNPVITGCPSDITVSANASCQAIANWTAPIATDNCSIASFTSSHTSGTFFSLGTTPVTYTATDGSGRTSTCTFNVIVNDNTNPVITGCPVDITVSADASCKANATWTAPTATDNCSISSFTSTHTSGFLFSLGTTLVIYTATDGSGRTSTCTFNVIVNDNTNPVITGCPSNITVSANAACQAIANWTAPTAADNCLISSFTSSHTSGTLFSLGTTPVTYTATDGSGRTSTCTFDVIVTDNMNPLITGCPANITLSANASCKAIANWTAPTATDNCSIASFTSSHTSGTLFSLGTTPVIYTATDGSGRTSTCTFDVIVNDNTNPVITGCPANITLSANASCKAIANWTAPTATDNCSIASFTSSHTSGTLFSYGTTPVTYTATDGSGRTSTCTFNVIVNDNTNPVITGCPANITLSANASCKAIANWTAPTATDNCSISSFTSSHTSGFLFSIGTTPVTYTATDGSGRTSTCTFNVIVNDNTNPVITGCPANITLSANASCKAIANWTAPTATDNCSISSFTSSHTPGFLFSIGTTPVTYTATDGSGRTSTCTFNVIVTDSTNPAITGCPSNITVSANASCKANVTWTAPTATDNCSIASFSSSHTSGFLFSVGTTPVTYTATDGSGNTSTCSFNVIVNDVTAPVLTGCPSSITVSANELCTASVSWSAPTVSDNCGTSTLISTHNAGTSFTLGTTQVTYTATDGSGNISTCSFNVIVNDTSGPVIAGCADVFGTAGLSCSANVSWPVPAVTDCGTFTLTSTHNPGESFPVGTTEVTYTATDIGGNSSSCKFNVIVNDETAPAFQNCSPEIVVKVGATCVSSVSWAVPTVSDNCGLATVTSSHSPGDTFPIGTTEVNYTAIDINGNVSVCQFNVVVKNENLPIISNCPSNIVVEGNESGEANVDWVKPTATAVCGEITLTSSHEPGDLFYIGTTQVEYKAIADAGNTSYCTFNVVVSQVEIEIDISKLITPDGDGKNDQWIVSNIEKFKENKVVIVDRWGSVVFTGAGYNNESVVWRGENRNGEIVPTGTYFYTISVRFGPALVEKSGFLEMIR